MWNAFCIVQLIRATANPFSRQVPFLFRCCCCFVSFCFTAYYRNLYVRTPTLRNDEWHCDGLQNGCGPDPQGPSL